MPAEASSLPPLPIEVPLLPSAFTERDEAFNQLKSLLLQSASEHPQVKALGMGGSGKTVMATSLVLDSEVRRQYEKVC